MLYPVGIKLVEALYGSICRSSQRVNTTIVSVYNIIGRLVGSLKNSSYIISMKGNKQFILFLVVLIAYTMVLKPLFW